MKKQLLYIMFLVWLSGCSDSNNEDINGTPDSINVSEQIVGRWMPFKTVLNDQVVYNRKTFTGMESDTHYERILFKNDQSVRKSTSDGNIDLFTWELNATNDTLILAKGQSNERRYFIENVSKDSLTYSIEPFAGHKVIYSFVKEHKKEINRSDLICKDWKYDLVWARLFSMDGFKYVRNGSVDNLFYEKAKVSFNTNGTFSVYSNNVLHEQGIWHLDLDDMLLVIEGDFKREATLLELKEDTMVFVFKNTKDNNIHYQMDFSTF
ncbi:hypothetical protein SAMN04487906_3211 [Zhouia amylolytica]|uniref:Lipocalin-like domain-containing protein n=2 Tax=Zhouia amylolytica TaxID=376730 RepID=W2UP72_9FLAO|nr:hypothetical protein [Zhouia amylolytica]ETN95256.1 hypothetical protein P278_09780 [Zhouia amylolytica AD3]SFT14508.1 hypothetical protein SAMN04487906_3211 [Zhouia amylolytica]